MRGLWDTFPSRRPPPRLPGPLGRLRGLVRPTRLLPRPGGLADPAASELVKRALAGLVRENAAPQRQARALGLAELAAIRATACQPRTGRQSGRTESGERARARGLADSALCAALFYGGLRRSEAAALAWGDVEPEADGSGLLTVRRSKTDPEDAGPGDPVFGL